MADIAKLKKMVSKLPVTDLQTILDYAGRRKVGKKRDLQARIIGLLHQPMAVRVKKKIKEVYDTFLEWHVTRSQQIDDDDDDDDDDNGRGDDDDDDDFDKPSRPKNSWAPIIRQQQRSWDDNINIYSAYNMLMDQQKTRTPRTNLYPYTQYLIEKPTLSTSVNNPLPNVQLKKLPFYEQIAVLLQPTSLIPKNRRLNETSFQFYFTPEQATDVISSFTIEPDVGKTNYIIQVQLRFCRLDSCEQHDDVFPPGLLLRVNGKLCSLPTPVPTNMVGMEPKRPPRPVDLTPYVEVTSDVANRIDIAWNPFVGQVYVVTVSLVKKLTSEHLLDQLRAKGFTAVEFTRRLIKAKMSEESGGEIAATSLRVSLACPLGKTRMTLPCRSDSCSHLQCFDASVFLNLNELRPTWMCPVCGQACPYDTLLLDGYFHELLTSTSLPKSVTEIQVDEKGTWSPYIKEEPLSSVSTTAQEYVLEEIAFDDIEVISMKPVSNKSKKTNRTEILVDLTNSDSEDETSSSSDEEISRNSDDEHRDLTKLVVEAVKTQSSAPVEPISVPGTGGNPKEWNHVYSDSSSDSSVMLIDLT